MRTFLLHFRGNNDFPAYALCVSAQVRACVCACLHKLVLSVMKLTDNVSTVVHNVSVGSV